MSEIAIIPKPISIVPTEGFTSLKNIIAVIVTCSQNISDHVIEFTKYIFEKELHIKNVVFVPKFLEKTQQTESILIISFEELKSENPEEYRLEISKSGVKIEAKTERGHFYALQSVRQLLETGHAILPHVTIHDAPRFPWRGFLFDVCRHFFPIEFVKRMIDMISFYKMNTLHFHLTEDQGWRIEIEKYPKLQTISAWRKESDGKIYGGYYTKQQIRELIEYANKRGVNIVPEIELPGHCMAALAAYPELSCTGGPFEVPNKWGIFKDVYCAGNDKVFQFLEDVLTEVIELFPSEYIHIGGDECPKDRWKECSKCQKRIKDEGLKDEHELQSYFVKRIAKFLNSKGRHLIGWDEIIEGGLAKDAIVQSWRGMEGALVAARAGHDVICSPTSHAYLDYSYLAISLKHIHSFEAIPEELEKEFHKHIRGGECNCWTEYMETSSRVEYQVFPRLIGMSEALWSPKGNKSYIEFLSRYTKHKPYLKKIGLNYGPESVGIEITTKISEDRKLLLHLNSVDDIPLDMHYTLDGTPPNKNSPKFGNTPVYLPTSCKVHAIGFYQGDTYGMVRDQDIVVNKATCQYVQYIQKYADKYPGRGEMTLVDGIRGDENYRSSAWQGWLGVDFEVIVHFQQPVSIRKVQTGFMQNINSYIWLPEWVEVSISQDGKNFTLIGKTENKIPKDQPGTILKDIIVEFEERQVLKVRIKAKSIGVCPPWHPGKGARAWTFADQILMF